MKAVDSITLKRLMKEINHELQKLNELFIEWESHRFTDWEDTFLLRCRASIFHDFYCGAENIFKRIAPKLNGGIPNGAEWQTTLLHNMLLEIPEVRPAVVSMETGQLLKTFLAFRHKFRLIFGFELDPEKMRKLDQVYPEAHTKFDEDIKKFIAFLEGLINKIESQP